MRHFLGAIQEGPFNIHFCLLVENFVFEKVNFQAKVTEE